MKGIEADTGERLSQILIDAGIARERIAVWVGPGHIQDFTAGIPNCMVVDGYDTDLKKQLADDFKSDLIRFYYGNDVIGTEIGAAAKNVMGIAAGILDGGGVSTLKGPLMSRGAREVARPDQGAGRKRILRLRAGAPRRLRGRRSFPAIRITACTAKCWSRGRSSPSSRRAS